MDFEATRGERISSTEPLSSFFPLTSTVAHHGTALIYNRAELSMTTFYTSVRIPEVGHDRMGAVLYVPQEV
jgi:hypothetical protein